jgi:hypothetical protein
LSHDEELKELCERYANDPLGFVRVFFDWGHGDLVGEDGPDVWQADVLTELGEYCRKTAKAKKGETPDPGPFQLAVASGHGIGKSALVSWIILWFMSCRTDPQIRVTANTETQLNTTTWRELAVWHGRINNKDWFTWTATKFYLNASPEKWYASAVAWSENNPEAFAGVHAENTLYLFDEASKISDVIWEKADGAMSTFGAMWLCFGNPTRNTGRFYDCFHKDRKYWVRRQIDSRTAKKANKVWVEQFIERRGLTDDRTKYQILGQFPSISSNQLIAPQSVEKCQAYKSEGHEYLPLLMGVDVARFGSNHSVVCFRRGRRVEDFIVFPKQDLMMTASRVADLMREKRPAQVFVDGSGIGAGVVDRLRQLNFSVLDVNGGNEPMNHRFLNKRAEMWWEMKEFIDGLCELPIGEKLEGVTLKDELCCVEYDYSRKAGRVFLTSKDEIMSEHGFSPDRADALSLTFAYPISDDAESSIELDPKQYAD